MMTDHSLGGEVMLMGCRFIRVDQVVTQMNRDHTFLIDDDGLN